MRALLLIGAIFFLCGTRGYAQKLIFENIGVRSGLPSTEVYHVLQDTKGYIWVFTQYGIVKYDGSRFKHVCKNIPLKERTVYSVFLKKHGFLYFTNSKANVYCVKNDQAYKINGLEKATKDVVVRGNNILDLFVDNYNGLYFSSSSVTYYYPESSYSITGGLKDTHYKDETPRFFCKKRYANKRLNVVFIDRNRNKYPPLEKISGGSRVVIKKIGATFYEASQGTVAMLVNGKVQDKIVFKTDIIHFEVDKEKHLWIGLLNGGLYELDHNLKIVNHYFDLLTVSSMLFDDQNGLWVSTIENGIYHCKDIKMKSYRDIQHLNASISMIKTVNGKLFVGTYKGNLFVKEGTAFRQVPIKNSLHAITDMEYCSGQYFVGSTHNFWVLDNHYKLLHFLEGATFGISAADNDRAVVVFPVNIGNYNLKEHKLHYPFKKGKTRCLAKNSRGEYFIISSHGILKMKDFKFEFPEELRKLKDENIIRIKIDRQDNVWFCSNGSGLYCWKTNHELIHYDNLPTNFVSDIDFSENGFAVISTNLGTFANQVKTIGDKTWNLIFKEESIRACIFENKLFIGTKFGLSSINTDELSRKEWYHFYLKSITNRGKLFKLRKELEFNYDQNNLDFNYDLLDYRISNSKLLYVLDGPAKQQDEIVGTQIQLQNLSPGEYTLKVKPILVNHKGPDLSVTTKFIIRPAFWQTWTFRIVVGVVVFSLIFLIFWLINYRRNKRLNEINRIENLLTEYRLTALKSQVNPHFMSNSLVAIQRLILENETDKANQYIAKFSLLLRSLLEYSSRSTATVRNELNMIELYVELEQLRFENQFVFEVKIGHDVDLDNTRMPALITQPFVENAIWHGLLPLDGKKEAKLVLSIQTSDNGILISVIDNGVGRNTNKEEKTHGEFESRGTSLIIQRLENLNRLYFTTGGRVEYIDLKDNNDQPVGTQVNIWLPNEILTQLYDGKNP